MLKKKNSQEESFSRVWREKFLKSLERKHPQGPQDPQEPQDLQDHQEERFSRGKFLKRKDPQDPQEERFSRGFSIEVSL